MKKILVLTLLLASSCAMADPFVWFTGVVNEWTDGPIETYAKEVVVILENVGSSAKNEYMYNLDVHTREMTNHQINEPLYYCTTVTLDDGREYRMAIRENKGEFIMVLEGELYYMALCSPHTTQGKLETDMLLLRIQASQLLEQGTEELKKHLDTYL